MKKLLFCLSLTLLLSGCGNSDTSSSSSGSSIDKYSTQIFAMDTVMDISVYAKDDAILTKASSLVTDLEKSLSTTDTNSEIYQLNQSKDAILSDDTAYLLERTLEFCAKTNGALDLSIYPVVRAWGFTTDSFQVPSQSEIDSLLSNVDYTKISYSKDEKHVILPEGMEIDFGSVAKGYTADKLAHLLKDNDISSALLNLGGNVQAVGSKPDGTPWKIAVKSPDDRTDYLGVLSVSDSAVVTSGGYERFFEDDDGNIYWHIIDPSTGTPAKNGIISATAIGPEGLYCDALSTSLFIMGAEKAEAFWKTYKDFDMILVTDEDEVIITPGIKSTFELTPNSPYHVTVIEE